MRKKKLTRAERDAIQLAQTAGLVEMEKAQVLKMIGSRINFLRGYANERSDEQVRILEQFQIFFLNNARKIV